MSYACEVKHDGRMHKLQIPEIVIPKCRACGEVVFSNNVDDQIMAALRSHLNLLTPEQIRAGRKALGLKSKELAKRLGVADATVSALGEEDDDPVAGDGQFAARLFRRARGAGGPVWARAGGGTGYDGRASMLWLASAADERIRMKEFSHAGLICICAFLSSDREARRGLTG